MDLLALIQANATVGLIFITVFVFCYYILARRNENFPPGPWCIPLIGNGYFFANLQKKRIKHTVGLMEATKKYGNIIGMKSFGQPFVFLHGYDAIHDAFVKHSDVTSNRPHWLKRLKEPTKEGKGIIWQSGHEWKLLRRFVLQTLRDFGVGKTSIEEKILVEVDTASEYLAGLNGKPTDPRLLTSMIITNVIYGIVFDKRYDFTDKEFHEMIHRLDQLFVGNSVGTQGDVQQMISRFFSSKAFKQQQERVKVIKWVKEHIYKEISDHEATFDDHNIRDFIDLYIKTRNEEKDENIFNKGNIFRVIMDLFLAGSETTSNTINWCILFMQEHPEVQRKCQEEIHEKFGSRTISWSDRSALPYVEATLQEIQRLANIAPSSLPHTNEIETTIGGYTIPAKTLIFANLYSANMDPEYWNEPKMFKPERFMKDGKLVRNPALIPFSTGPRVCLGEVLARMEMFLVFTNLLQKFTFMREDDNVPHSMEAIFEQNTSCPLPYKTKAIRRV